MSEHIDRLLELVDRVIGPAIRKPKPEAKEEDGAYLVPDEWWDERPAR